MFDVDENSQRYREIYDLVTRVYDYVMNDEFCQSIMCREGGNDGDPEEEPPSTDYNKD